MLRITRPILSLVAALTAALAFEAATASGAKVAVANRALVYTGVGTEANDLRLARHGGDLIVRDLTATLVPGAGCTRVTGHKATCAGAGVVGFRAGLGRGNDRAVVADLVRPADDRRSPARRGPTRSRRWSRTWPSTGEGGATGSWEGRARTSSRAGGGRTSSVAGAVPTGSRAGAETI